MPTITGAGLVMALLVVSAAGPIQTSPPADIPTLASLSLPLDTIAGRGRQVFDWQLLPSDGVKLAGSLVMTTDVADGKATLTDRLDVESRITAFWSQQTSTCGLTAELRPEHVRCTGIKGRDDGNVYQFNQGFDVQTSSVTGTVEPQDLSLLLPPGTVSINALYRLVTILPRTVGFRASYDHLLDSNELHLQPGGMIACTGVETIQRNAQPAKTWRFDVTSDKRVALSAWVDGDGRLIQARVGEHVLIVAKD